jgi:hypothetical protein
MSTETLPFKQNSHLHPALSDPAATANVASLLGHWKNTNRETRGIAECVVAQDAEGVTVSITGASDPIEWPIARATVLANLEEEANQRTIALLADFAFGFMTAETHVRVNKGVLVIVLYVTFHDDSARSNYLNREFFYRVD